MLAFEVGDMFFKDFYLNNLSKKLTTILLIESISIKDGKKYLKFKKISNNQIIARGELQENSLASLVTEYDWKYIKK